DVLEAVGREVRRRIAVQQRRAIGDERRRLAVALLVVILDHLRVAHDGVGENECEPFAGRIPRPPAQPPLPPLAPAPFHLQPACPARPRSRSPFTPPAVRGPGGMPATTAFPRCPSQTASWGWTRAPGAPSRAFATAGRYSPER